MTITPVWEARDVSHLIIELPKKIWKSKKVKIDFWKTNYCNPFSNGLVFSGKHVQQLLSIYCISDFNRLLVFC